MNDKKTIAVTGKISVDEFNLLNQKIQENPLLNKSAIVSQSLSNYLHGKTGDVDPKLKDENESLKIQVKNLTEEKTGLENKITELSEALSKQSAANPETLKALESLKAESESLKTENENLKTEIEKLKNQPPKTLKLSPNQLLINVPPTLQPFLVEVTNRETNRTGHKVTPEMILLNLFWAQVSKGPGDHLPMTFSPSEIRRRLEIVKQNQNQKPTA